MDRRTPSLLSASAATIPSHQVGDAQQLHPDTPASNFTRIQPRWQTLTILSSICTLATEFAIVVCLAYALVAAVIFLTGPPSTTPIDFVGILGPLCLFTALAFAAVGLMRGLVWFVGWIVKTREKEGVFTDEAKDGGVDKLSARAEWDVEAGGGEGKRKIQVLLPQDIFPQCDELI